MSRPVLAGVPRWSAKRHRLERDDRGRWVPVGGPDDPARDDDDNDATRSGLAGESHRPAPVASTPPRTVDREVVG